MTTPRETKAVSTRASVAGSLQGPPRLPRSSTTSATSVGDPTRRQRERESVVLAQIVGRAMRFRADVQGKPTAMDAATAPPLTLIELIQASTAVFAKHGIVAPDDAVYHRYLLTLSLDPEPDWKKKIQRFALTKSSRDARRTSDRTDATAFTPRASSVGSISNAAPRRSSMTLSEINGRTPVRQQSGVGVESRTPGWIPPGVAASSLTGRTPQGKRRSMDQFGDVLATATTQKETTPKESQLRTASRVEVGTETDDVVVKTRPVTAAEKLDDLETIRSKLHELSAELTVEGEGEDDENDDDDADNDHDDTFSYVTTTAFELDDGDSHSESISASVRSIPPHAHYPSPSRTSTPSEDQPYYPSPSRTSTPSEDEGTRPPTHFETDSPSVRVRTRIESRHTTDNFRRLATSFQQWRELATFHRLVRDSRQRELRLTQAVLPPIATFAIFRWIVMTLPERTRDSSTRLSSALPTCVVSRGVASHNPSLLRHFTGRLLVWTVHRIFRTWAWSARTVKTMRIKSLIRARTQVLESAFDCLAQWRRFTRSRRRINDHATWVETLHSRKCLRSSLRVWRNELRIRKREHDAADRHRLKTQVNVLKYWRRRTTQCRTARDQGSRRILQRSLRIWRETILWSEEEHWQIMRSRAHFVKRLMRCCLVMWRKKVPTSKAKRLRVMKAARYHYANSTRRVWVAWIESYLKRKSLEQKCRRFKKRRQARTLRRLLLGISGFVHVKRYRTLMVLDACARRESRLLQRVWNAWMHHHELTLEVDGSRTKSWFVHRTRRIWTVWKRKTNLMRLSGTIKACFDSSVTRMTFARWQTWMKKRRYYRDLVSDWRDEQDHLLKQRVFMAFQANGKLGRLKQHAVQGFLNRCADTRLQSFVWAWREVACSRTNSRRLDDQRVHAWSDTQLRRYWTTWRQAFHVAQCIHMADEARTQGMRRRYFRLWQKSVDSRKSTDRFAVQLQRARVTRAVRTWCSRIKANKTDREKMTEISCQREQFIMHRGWRVWRDAFAGAKHRHSQAALAILRWQNKRLELFFLEWKTSHARRKALQALLVTWQQGSETKSLRIGWRSWVAYISFKHEKKALIMEAQQHHDSRALGRAIQDWRFQCKHSHAQILVLQKCAAHWACNKRQRFFTRWKNLVVLRRLVRAMSHQSDSKIIQRYFAIWRGWKRHREITAVTFAERATRLDHWTMHQAVRRLRCHAIMSKRMASLQGLVRLAGARGLQTACFRRWLAFTKTNTQRKIDAGARNTHMSAFRQRQHVQRWIRFTRLKKLLVSTLVQAKDRKRSGQTARTFAKWRQYVVERKLFYALKEKAHVFQALSLLPTYYHAWRRYVVQQKRKQQLVLRASQLFCHQQESRAFTCWKEFTSRTKKGRSAIQMWRNQSMLARFTRWRGFVTLKKAKRKATAHHETVTRKQILSEWYQAAHRSRLLKHFTELWHAQTTEQYFHRWAKHTKATRCARSLLRRLQNASLTRVFNSWKTLIDQQLQLSGDIQRRFVLLWNQDRAMTSFQRWKALADRQKLVKKRILHHIQKQTITFFAHWRLVIARRKVIAAQSTTVHRQCQLHLLSTYWRTWKSKKATHDTVNTLRRRIMMQSSGVLLQSLFREWRTIVRKLILAKTARSTKQRELKAVILTRWKHVFVNRRRRERHATTVTQQRYELRIVKRVILLMRARMTIKNACTRVFLPQLQRHLLTGAWESWLRYHDQKRQTHVLVESLRQSVVNSRPSTQEYLLVSLGRWRAIQQARCFERWSMVTKEHRWMRSHTIKAMHVWEHRLSAACLRAWVAWNTHQKRKHALQTRSAKRQQARAWCRWIRFHQDQRFQACLEGKASCFHRKHIQATTMAAWRSVLARRRHHVLLETALTLHRTKRSLQKWQGVAVHRRSHRMQLTVASVAAHHKRLAVAWNQWTQYLAQAKTHRQGLQQHTERLQVLILCSTFRAWSAWSQNKRKTHRIIAFLSTRCDTKTARQVIRSWARHTKAMRMTRVLISKFDWETSVRKAVKALRFNAVEQIAKREAARKARQWIGVLQGRFVQRSFQSWQRFAAVRKKTRLVIQRYNSTKILPTAFHAWKQFVQVQLNKSTRLEKAMSCWRSMFVRRAWSGWYEYHQMRTSSHLAAFKARQHFTSRVLRRVVVGWRDTILKKRHMGESCRKLLVRWKMQTAYRCFASWQGYSLQQKARRVSAAIVSSRLASLELQVAWSQWRREFVVNRIGRRKGVARVFQKWQEWRRQRRDWRDFQAAQSQALLLNVGARKGIVAWKEFVVQAKMSKTMTLLSGRFSKDTLVKRCFEKWLQYLVIRHREKEKMKRVVVWIRDRQLIRCFQALARYAELQNHKRQRQESAAAHATQQSYRKVFMAWKNGTLTAKSQRQKLRRYVDVMQHVTQRKSFAAWREYATKRVQLRSRFAQLLSQRTQFTTQAVFDEWKCSTAKTKRRKVAEGFSCARLCSQILRQWRKYLILTRVEALLGASEQRLLEGCFVGWRKRTVLHQSVRRLGQEKRARDRSDSLKRHLLAWRSWTHIQSKCSSLLANVALGHHLRLRFLMWRKFAQKHKKLRLLVVGTELEQAGEPMSVTNGESDLQVLTDQQPALRLVRMARFFQQFQVDWDDKATVWQRWRHTFHAVLFYRMRRLYKIFSAWQSWSRRRRALRTICLARQTARESSLKRTLLLRWRQVVATVKHIQRERQRERELLVIVNAAMLRQERTILQRHWIAWRERTENKRYLLISVDSYQRARVLTKFWLLWSHDFVSEMKRLRQQHVMRASRMSALKALRVIQRLQLHQAWCVKTRHVLSTLQQSRHDRWYRICLDHWRRFADTKRRARLLTVFKKRQTVQRAYLAWRVWMEGRHQQALAVKAFEQRRTMNMRAARFLKWRVYVRQRHKWEDAMILATDHHLRHCLRSRWLRTVQAQKRVRQALELPTAALIQWRHRRAIARWRNSVQSQRLWKSLKLFVQRKHFSMWKCHVHTTLADRFRSRLLQKRVNVVWKAWAQMASRQCHLKSIEGHLSDLRTQRREHQVWTAWHQFVLRKQNQRSSKQHHDRVITTKVLLEWYDAATVARTQRTKRLQVAEAFHVFSTKRVVLRKWVSALVRARQRRAVLLTCVLKIQRAYDMRLQQVVLRVWSDAADLERFGRECADSLQQLRVRRTIRRWRRQISERRRHEHLQRDAITYRQQRLLSEVFFHWQNYALAWKDAESVRVKTATFKPVVLPPPPPVLTIDETIDHETISDDGDESLRFRRPLSPMKKRLRAKGQNRLLDPDDRDAPVPSFADAATLSLDVKKRLLVLGKWKPGHTSLSHA